MGKVYSYFHPPTPPQPWRTVDWGNNQNFVDWLASCGPANRPLKILLYGPVGAGKSSFINSVQSVLRNRMHNQRPVGTIGDKSFTTRCTVHRIPMEGRDSYPFVLIDTIGVENIQQTEEVVKLALRGHLRHGFEFKPGANIATDPLYNPTPAAEDQVDVAVCICPMDIAFPLDDRLLNGIRAILLEARDLDIPHRAIITKIDLLPLSNLRSVYSEELLKTKMESFCASSGIPMNCIFPVKNYHIETNLNDDISALVLDALKNVVTAGIDHLEEVQPRNQLAAGSGQLISL